ncbi:DUF3604 domain-containing protein [Oceanicoccus sp. KOV_DT_Chl]|uniref:DUF3604 domain-containing protein n=1 Tax=Oceanicoccus sp. KOV_DT_Chl TaxID=1904639 RepID=UPI000C7A7E35|nr:DUF3604 domain-containing protein [Oceanicoccus sp. KOV_DT_Chl]
MSKKCLNLAGIVAACCLLVATTQAAVTDDSHSLLGSSALHVPCTDRTPLRRAFFGDTHVHTKYSLDASTQDTRTTPAQAYQFAKGEKIGIQPWSDDGQPLRYLQLARPLDFAMVTDHAELMGEVSICNTPGLDGYGSWQCMIYRNFPRVGYYLFNATAMSMKTRLGFCGDDGQICIQAASMPWQEMQQAATDAYDQSENCEFTSFVAFEWTGVSSSSDGAQNRHRNVIFRNDAVPSLPINSVETPAAHQLWDSLDEQCIDAGTGCDVIVIPHNSNLSDGSMFTGMRGDQPITATDARQTARFETLVEVMQHKGSSECFFGAYAGVPEDELCAFEQLPYNNFSGQSFESQREIPRPEGDFLREVLRDGLRYQQKLGVNPFKWGFIGSTDTHLGAPGATAEDNFLGHGGAGEPASESVNVLPDALEFNPGGLAVLWAEQNTRDSLFAAMRRREAFGTSGPRMTVRFFGGWDYPQNLCEQADFVEQGYAGGVPMGGDLTLAANAQMAAPRFAVQASKDPGDINGSGTPLQRIQIIKGWVDAKGVSQEAIYEVAGNPDNGAAVNLSSCETRGSGYQQLCTVWQDPAFNAEENAWYYARVVENPTCRWSQKICAGNGVDCSNPKTITDGLEACCSEEHRPVIQERAWTSPIWYNAPHD